MSNPRLGATDACYPPPTDCVKMGSSSLTMSQKGVKFLLKHEGFKPSLYNDALGHCTIGYGYLVHRGKCNGSLNEEPFRDKKGNPTSLTKAQATDQFSQKLGPYIDGVRNNVDVELTQYEFDALVSFSYNLGANILKGSTLLKYINAGKWDRIHNEIMKYNKGRVNGRLQIIKGLTNRRYAEANMFFGIY
jgi:GH24 family phage-related lysozyme (muramidase)